MSKKSPQLRFEGFTDDWEERKLENIAQINKGIQRGKQEISSVRNELNPYPVYNGGKKASGYTDECNRENSVMVSEGGASAGYVNYYSGKYWSGGHNFTISNDTKHDTFFLLYVLQKSQEKLYKLQVGTGLPNIQLKSIKDFPIYSTSNTEQQKIGSFFKQLDNTIALHQRKLDLLKEQKKGFLQKMFPKNGAKVPELRFAGFADDWEERKLAEFTTSFSGGTPSAGNSSYYKGDIPFIRSGEINSDKTELFLTEDGLKNSSAKMVSVGDILYALYGATSGEVGISQINGAINQAILAIRPIGGYSSHFIMQWLRLQKQKIIDKYLQGGQGNLSGSIVKNLILNVPNFEEQQRIGSFFKQLDDTIALHQRKLDLLKEQKKGYLQKMFPKNGAKVPELRFAGFADDWEQRKLGEVADIIGGGTPSTNVSEYWNGDIDWYSPVEIGNQIYIDESQKKITGLGLQKSSAHILPVGTVLFTSRAGIGNTAILAKEGCTNQGFQSIVPYKDLLNSYFIFSRTSELKRYGEINGAGSTFIEVSGKQMAKMPISVPSIEEQQKIGTFFKQLDDTITLHQRKLDLLKEQRKGFLQNMFV